MSLTVTPSTGPVDEAIQALPEGSTHLADGVRRYLHEGKRPGEFLTALFAHDLLEASRNADAKNAENLAELGNWLYWYIPSRCQGSYKKVRNWHGMKYETYH